MINIPPKYVLKRILWIGLFTFLLWALVVLVVSSIFFFTNGKFNGVLLAHNNSTINFSDCVYFSIVSATTAGYGEYVPTGWFRVISIFITIFGIASSGIFIAIITSELIDPLSILNKYSGWWFKESEIKTKENTNGNIRNLVTLFRIERRAFRWVCKGDNFNLDGTKRHSFDGHITGIDDTTIYIPFRNEPSAKVDFTSGVWVITFEEFSDGTSFSCYTYDDEHGRRDNSFGISLNGRNNRDILTKIRSMSSKERKKAIEDLRKITNDLKPHIPR